MTEAHHDRATEQRAEATGHGNVTVQIVGDGNRVALGCAEFRITRYPKERGRTGGAAFLAPYARAIRTVGRDAERRALHEWLGSPKPIAVQVRTGPAGRGKTRLALDLCDEIAEDGIAGQRWQAGFANSAHLKAFCASVGAASWRWDETTLVVVDNAGLVAPLLHNFLSQLTDYSPPDLPRLRILLLERHADPASGWWQTLFPTGSWRDDAICELLEPDRPLELPKLADVRERRDVLDLTMREQSDTLRPPEIGSNPDFERRLSELTWGGEPLFLMMAGVVAAETGIAEVLTLGRAGLAVRLADRELKRVRDHAGDNPSRQAMLTHLAGYATLCGGLDYDGAMQAAAQEKAALRRPSAGDDAELADLLHQALPRADGGIEPILPDVIGEAVILRAFEPLKERSATVVQRAFAQAGQPVAASVIRTAQDFAGAGYEQPLAWLDALIERDEVDVDQLMLIAGTLPQTSLPCGSTRCG